MNITVIGLGKIGLPLAVKFASKNFKVYGTDIDAETVELVNKGIEPFSGEANLQVFLSKVVSSGLLRASTSTSECVAKSNVVVVVVPLLVNSNAEPDFKALDDATTSIGLGLKPGTLVLYETTLPIGTTRNRFTVALEKLSGLSVGKDFNVAFSPERVLTGRVFADLKRYPKIVGGVTRSCSIAAEKFYQKVLEFDLRPELTPPNGVWKMESSEAAEFVKLAETTYRDVNIGLVNQFAVYASSIGVNIHEVITSANSQPYSHLHQPGIAVGGHCIPVYPLLYLSTDPDASLVALARKVNEKMPSYSIDRVVSEFGQIKDCRVLILGASYRAHVKETAFSGVYSLINIIKEYGGIPEVVDPLYSARELELLGIPPFEGNSQGIKIAIVQNEDVSYKTFLTNKLNFADLKMIFDGRNLFGDTKEINGVRISSI